MPTTSPVTGDGYPSQIPGLLTKHSNQRNALNDRIQINSFQFPGLILFCSVTRFAKYAELLSVYFLAISGEVSPADLCAGASYTVYLVYKLASSSCGLRGFVQTSSLRLHGEHTVATSKVSLGQEACASDSDVTYPVPRSDGWLELKLAEFTNDDEMRQEKGVIVDLREENVAVEKRGLIVEGMEFRSN